MWANSLKKGFLCDQNDRGWMVIHQGNLSSECKIFFLFIFEEISDCVKNTRKQL